MTPLQLMRLGCPNCAADPGRSCSVGTACGMYETCLARAKGQHHADMMSKLAVFDRAHPVTRDPHRGSTTWSLADPRTTL